MTSAAVVIPGPFGRPLSCACGLTACKCNGGQFLPNDPGNTCAAPASALVTTPSKCCLLPVCGRLRLVVLCLSPCSPLPTTTAPVSGSVVTGVGATVAAVGVNQPPATTITAGMPFGVVISGRPAAYLDPVPVPQSVRAALGRAAAKGATSLVYDFGSIGAVSACGSYKCAEGKVMALGAKGAAQASLAFKFRFCAPLQKCGKLLTGDGAPPVFEVVDCSSKGMTFVVVDSTTFLSTDPCTESLVIVNLQQYCPGPLYVPATPPTVPWCPTAPLPPMDVKALLGCQCFGGGASGLAGTTNST
jgi:hypothetical protein